MTVEEAKAFIAKRREEKAAAEKARERELEIKRREDGKKSQEMAEQIVEIQRKREADKIKADKEAKEWERKRLQVELLRDKIERHQKTKGTVPHELMEQLAVLEGLKTAAPVVTDPRLPMKGALAGLSVFKEGKGLVAAQTLRVLCANPLEKPGDAKFRTINLANEKIRERVTGLPGGLAFLRAAGWRKDDATNTMNLPDDARDEAVLRAALEEIDAAIAGGLFA